MSMKLLLLSPTSSASSLSQPTTLFSSHSKPTKPISSPNLLFRWTPQRFSFSNNKKRMSLKACVKVQEEERKNVLESSGINWGMVSAVLFDMDGVLAIVKNLLERPPWKSLLKWELRPPSRTSFHLEELEELKVNVT